MSDFVGGVLLASVVWMFLLLVMAIGHENEEKRKDRMMELCVEKDAKYADCLAAWEGKK